MIQSLCETCTHKKEVVSAKGSRFLLCQLSPPLETWQIPKRPDSCSCTGVPGATVHVRREGEMPARATQVQLIAPRNRGLLG